jgi:hypothetical protein
MQAKVLSNSRTVKIRELNDTFRRTFSRGRVVFTSGVAALGRETISKAVEAIQTFDDFDTDNDPHGEHDFVSVEVGNETFFWKVDYYDRDIRFAADDPSDPRQTIRVATIMLSSEY